MMVLLAAGWPSFALYCHKGREKSTNRSIGNNGTESHFFETSILCSPAQVFTGIVNQIKRWLKVSYYSFIRVQEMYAISMQI